MWTENLGVKTSLQLLSGLILSHTSVLSPSKQMHVCEDTWQTHELTAHFYKRSTSSHFQTLFPCTVSFHYICWALSSSTDSSSSFIWLLSSSSWEFGSSGSSRALPPCDAPSELAAAAGLGLASVLTAPGLWSDGDWDKVFVEGCEDKKREQLKSQTDRDLQSVWTSTGGMDSVLLKRYSPAEGHSMYDSNYSVILCTGHCHPASRTEMFHHNIKVMTLNNQKWFAVTLSPPGTNKNICWWTMTHLIISLFSFSASLNCQMSIYNERFMHCSPTATTFSLQFSFKRLSDHPVLIFCRVFFLKL